MHKIIFTLENNTYNVNHDDPFYFNGLIQQTFNFGELLIDFYEIDLNVFAQKIDLPIPSYSLEEIEEYIYECQSVLSEEFNPIIVALMLNSIEKEFFSQSLQNNRAFESVLNGAFKDFGTLQNFTEIILNNDLTDISLINDLALILQSISAKFYLINGKMQLALVLEEIYSLIALEILNIQSHDIKIKDCENCNKFFIPDTRSDEIYCNRVFKNGRTCKQVGYEEKEKNDPFKYAFAKARKTQHARIRYNQHNPDYKSDHYEPWKKAAEKARDKFREENDIEGFRKWLADNKNNF